MIQLLGAVLRGLRARALLSVGSVLLTLLAVGSAVLGPIFAEAVTNSYVVTRLREAPPALTGLSRQFTPEDRTDAVAAERAAVVASDGFNQGPWGEPVTVLESPRFSALRGVVRFWARDGGCEALEVEGRCPQAPGEVLMLAQDRAKTGAEVSRPLRLDIYEPPEIAGRYPRATRDTVTVVGTYTTPETAADWLDPTLLTSTNEQSSIRGGYQPYSPAPLIATRETVEALGGWTVRVDTPLDVPADVTRDDLALAVDSATALPDEGAVEVEGGELLDVGTTDLGAVETEVEAQQATARSSIAPAVLSLVLVALALLMRLLNAASEIRIPELALAALRGVTARRLWGLGLAEPVVLLLVSAPLGVAAGLALSWGLVRAWLVPGMPVPLVAGSWLAAAGVLLAAFAVATVAVGLVVRDSLASQLSGVRRPTSSRRWSVVAQLTLVALALAVLVSKVAGGRQGDPDATDLVLPVLLAIVAGLAATGLTAWLAGWWTRRTTSRSLSGFVSSRAISRRQEGTLVILPVTAAIAVAVFGAGVHDSAATWRTSVAATVSPAHTTWTTPLTMAETVALTRSLDPEGQWVMAAASVQNPGASFAIVDTDRLARVATWPETWSPDRSVEEVAAAIRPDGTVPQVAGRRLTLTVDNQVVSDKPLAAEVRFGSRGSTTRRVYLGPFEQGRSTLTVPIPMCTDGCPLEGLTLAGGAGTTMQMSGTVTLVSVEVDGQPVEGALEGAGWTPTPDPAVRPSVQDLRLEDGALVVDVESGDTPAMARLTSGGLSMQRPALRGGKVRDDALAKLDEGYGLAPVEPVGDLLGMPFVGPAGLLVDYSSFTTDRPVYDNLLDVRVLMREGAPASIRDGLSAAGLSVQTTLAQERAVLDQGAYALALRLYAVVAALVLLMALAGLFVSTAVQLPARRRDAAALRVVGVPRRSVMAAVAREYAVVLGGATLAGILAGTLAQWVVLRTITLGYVEDLATPEMVVSISPARLVVMALLAAAVLGLIAFVSASLTVRGARGATLRESAR